MAHEPMAEAAVEIREVDGDEWTVLRWLWQLFRYDLVPIVHGWPYPDGRYQARELDRLPSPDGTAYLAWRAHPKTGAPAPIAFAVVGGLRKPERTITGFWVVPEARREGVGERLALEVIGRHAGPWVIAFQHDNLAAGNFWRRVADVAFGAGRWTEEMRPVPDVPHAPPDHFIVSRTEEDHPA